MSDTHSTPVRKPDKPRPDFPLFPHASGQWAKKIRGQMHYFGKWDDPDAALDSYLKQKDDLHNGRTPRPAPEGITVKDAVNSFLNHKQALLTNGEICRRTWIEYKEACDILVPAFSKTRLLDDLQPEHFAALRKRLTQRWGPVRLTNGMNRIRSVFKHAFEAGMIDHPVRFGPAFRSPTQKVLRLHRAAGGPKLFSSQEVRRLIDAANPTLRAMIFLGINAGFGNSDCGNLPLSAVDLDAGIVAYPRPKTGASRRCPLWPETVEAIREVLARRPKPKKAEYANLVFLTRFGGSWYTATVGSTITVVFRKLLKALAINGRRGLGFYTLRHTFRTVADEARDQPAADRIMGHVSEHISDTYRETISDARLRAVADHVRTWLFPPPKKDERQEKADAATEVVGGTEAGQD
jgi:integrase